jgi:mannosyltransferase
MQARIAPTVEEGHRAESPAQHMTTDLSSPRQGPSAVLALLVAIALLGGALRLYQLDVDSLWIDEMDTAIWSQLDLPSLVARVAVDNHVPLTYMVTRVFVALFGDSEFMLRFPPVLFGTLSILLVYKTGATIWSSEAGLVGAFLLATNAYHVRYSQEARHYALMVFLALLSLIFLTKALQRNHTRLWIGFVLCTSLSLYNHYFAFLFLLAEAIFGACVIGENWLRDEAKGNDAFAAKSRRGRTGATRQALMFAASLAVVAVSYLPWLSTARALVVRQTGPSPIAVSMGTVLSSLGFLRTAMNAYGGAGGAVMVLWLVLFALGVATSDRKRTALALSWIGIPFVFLAAIEPEHTLHPRYVLFTLPLCLLMIAVGITSILSFLQQRIYASRPEGRRFLVVTWSCLGIIGLLAAAPLGDYYLWEKENWRGAAAYLTKNMRAEDIIVADGRRAVWGDARRAVRGLSYYGIQERVIIKARSGLWQRLRDMEQWSGEAWAVLWYPGELRATAPVTVADFHQVPVVRLREPSGDALQDTVSLLQTLLEVLPAPETHFDVHLALAEIYLRTGRFGQAELELDMASQVKPGSAEALQELAATRADFEHLSQVAGEGISHTSRRSAGLQVAIIGYELHPSAPLPAGTLEVVLWWQALADMDRGYTAVVRLVSNGNEIWAQQDKLLRRDSGATPAWRVGEILREEYELPLPADIPRGEYKVVASVYNSETRERLPVWDENGERVADDAILLGPAILAD